MRKKPTKKRCFSILPFILIICTLWGCSKSKASIVGEYEFDEIVYFGLLSSSTYDALVVKKSGTRYSIKEDSLSIINDVNEIMFLNIHFTKETMDDKFIKANYVDVDPRVLEFFGKYNNKIRYSVFDDKDMKIAYYIFLFDNEVFISRFARNDTLIFTIDKIVNNAE